MQKLLLKAILLASLTSPTWAAGIDAKKLAGIWFATTAGPAHFGAAEFTLSEEGETQYRVVSDGIPMPKPGCSGNYKLQKAALVIVISDCSAVGIEEPLAITFTVDLSGVTLRQITSYDRPFLVHVAISGFPGGHIDTERVDFMLTKRRESYFKEWDEAHGL